MISENEKPTSETNDANNDKLNKNADTGAPKEDALSILEKRLAEINARKNASGTGSENAAPESASTPTPPLPTTPEPETPNPTAGGQTEIRIERNSEEPVSEDQATEAPNVSRPLQPEVPEAPVTETPLNPESDSTKFTHRSEPEEVAPVKSGNPEPMPEESQRPASAENPDPNKELDAGDVISGAVAFHEVIPPVEPGGTVLNPEAEKARPATGFSSGNDTDSDTPERAETPVGAENSDISTERPVNPDEATRSVFNANLTGPGNMAKDGLDGTADEANKTGNIIAGAIAAHEVMPEVAAGNRKENVPAADKPEIIAGNNFDEASEEEHDADLDYAAMPFAELQRQLALMLKNPENRKNYRQVNTVYREYEIKLAAEKQEAQERFVSDGGSADDFEYRLTPEQQELERNMQQFRESRQKDQRSEEEQKTKNLQRKQTLLAEMREVVEAAETKSSADKMKAIQEEWKAIGPVPQAESQQLWNSYHALLDIFYNNRSIYFELKELDRKRNLNAKLQLCERAEALTGNPSINESLQELRHLHEEWKNIGPVPNEQRDQIWERFINASEKVHERKKEYLAGRREAETQNLSKKTEVLQRLEAFKDYKTDRINDWRDKTDEIQKIKEEWDAIGLVPKENADQVNKRFWGIYKGFFHNKNLFFKALDEQKMQNLKLKTELCEQAEAVKDSEDWDTTKEQLIQLQKKWKTIGRVPDKYSDKIWERFRAACNEFFDRRQAVTQNREAELDKLSAEKTAYLEELTQKLGHHEHPQAGNLDTLEEMVAKWKSFSTDHSRANVRAEEAFYGLMDNYLDTIPDLTNEEKNDLRFRLQLTKLKGSPDSNHKIHQKELSIRKEISQLENDIRTLKTNIEFFARSKNAEKLREEYEVRTQEAYQRIELLQKQLKELRS